MSETFTEGAITRAKRAMLVDWLVEVTEDFKLLADTLHLAVSYVDRTSGDRASSPGP
jgi:cyclin A